MDQPKLQDRELQAVHKFVYLANEYPEKQVQEVAALFQWSPLDLNCAIWRAEDLNFFTIEEYVADEELSPAQQAAEKAKGGKLTIHNVPDAWEFGPEVESIKASILYAFGRLAKLEADMEENYFGNWTAGYPAHDVMIATKALINEKKIATYEIKDRVELPLSKKAKGKGVKPEIREDIYTFYTLFENLENRWGAKQFKEQENLR